MYHNVAKIQTFLKNVHSTSPD